MKYIFKIFLFRKDEEITQNEPKPKTIWIHLSCGLWTPEVYLEEKKSNINIKGNLKKKWI